jgi:hypothetical protein
MKHSYPYLTLFLTSALAVSANPGTHTPSSADGFHQMTSPGHHATQNPGQPFDHGPGDISAGFRKGFTPGYYLGFRSLADEMRNLRRPSNIPVTKGFLKTLYLDVHYMNQEFNGKFFDSTKANSSAYDEPIENDLYGLTLGMGLGGNPNLQVRIPLSISRFEVGGLDDRGMTAGIEMFPNYRINEYVAWGVNISHVNSSSDFPIFDESLTRISFEAMAESSPAYGMNWSARLSIGRYYPSNEANDEAFWLFRGGLALHYHLHQNFTLLPFVRLNHSTGDVLTDALWVDYGTEFILMPNAPWNFSLGIAGVGGHDVIEEGMEFYFSTKKNF